MKIEQIQREVDGIPHMAISHARLMTEFILDYQPQNILELGFRHGVSTCYMAGALKETGRGSITTVDLETARALQPNIETLLTKLGLRDLVTVFYEPTSYIWRLMKMLEASPVPRFDLCYLDGAHSWFVDGFAFFLVDRLLVPGGWIIFDDLDWTYASSPALKDSSLVRAMPHEEANCPQVRKVYELLVKTHPAYSESSERDGWAYARKDSDGASTRSSEVRREVVYRKEYLGLGGALLKVARHVIRRTRT
jgi:predicted O-methyltransferase YrrM